MTHRMGVISDETGGVEHIPLLARRICFLFTESYWRRWDLAITLGMFAVENGWWYTPDGCESGCCAKYSHIALMVFLGLGSHDSIEPNDFYQSTTLSQRVVGLLPIFFI